MSRPWVKIPRAKIYFGPHSWWAACRTVLKGEVYGRDAVRLFEERFAAYLGVPHARAVASGRLALKVALAACRAGEGDEIIVPAYTCRVVIQSLLYAGVRPVFADIDHDTWNMAPRTVRSRISPRTRFLLMTHIHGLPCEVDTLLELAREHGLTVIEDAAAACGGEYRGRKLGTFGEIGYFSFSLYKNINTLGGGMLVTGDAEMMKAIDRVLSSLELTRPSRLALGRRLLFAMAASLLTHPLVFSFTAWPALYALNRLGLQERFSRLLVALDDGTPPRQPPPEYREEFVNLQGAIGQAQLATLDRDNEARRRNAAVLNRELGGSGLAISDSVSEAGSIALNYVVRVGARERCIGELMRRGIDCMPGYVECCPEIPAFSRFAGDCPVARRMVGDKLYLPNHPPLGERQMRYLGQTLRSLVAEDADFLGSPVRGDAESPDAGVGMRVA